MAGDAETGVAIMRVTAGWDSGAGLRARHRADPARRRLRHARPAPRGRSAPNCWSRRSTSARRRGEQDEAQVTYAHKIGPRERALDPTQTPGGGRAHDPRAAPAHRLAAAAARRHVPRRDRGRARRPDPRARRRPRPHRRRPAAARLPRRRARADRDPPARRAPDGRRRLAARPPRPGPGRTSASTPRCPAASSTSCSSAPAAEWADADDEWQPHVCALAARGSRDVLDAMIELGAGPRSGRPAQLAAYVLGQLGTAAPALPGRAGRRAARDGRARGGPRGPVRDRLRLRPPRRRRTATTGCSPSAPTTGRGRPRGGGVRARRAPGRRRAGGADRALRRRRGGVRDWATFALGTLAEADAEELRDALAARLDDPDEDTRLEAVHGLAVRGDPRAEAAARDLLAAHGDAEGDGVWTRHLLAETASHLEALTRLGRRRCGARGGQWLDKRADATRRAWRPGPPGPRRPRRPPAPARERARWPGRPGGAGARRRSGTRRRRPDGRSLGHGGGGRSGRPRRGAGASSGGSLERAGAGGRAVPGGGGGSLLGRRGRLGRRLLGRRRASGRGPRSPGPVPGRAPRWPGSPRPAVVGSAGTVGRLVGSGVGASVAGCVDRRRLDRAARARARGRPSARA